MRYSQLLIPTMKEVPADAEIISHQLMLRAGLMRKLASGTYIYLPAGFRVLHKIINIVREEMNRSGAQEVLAPVVQPIELWEKTGRDVDYGETLGRFTDRHGRGNVLSPTAEEVMTYLGACEINSYKQLKSPSPNLYQINTKYRDEFRPRFGVLRTREFIMKDSYSYHADVDTLEETYKLMYDTYCRIFERCGIEYVIVEAETGEMGGSGSHQFTVPCENGEDVIVYTDDSSIAWNIEKAPVDAMVKPNKDVQVGPTENIHTPGVGSIEEVAKFLKKKPRDMIKTIIFSTPDTADTDQKVNVMILVRGDHEINPEKLAQLVPGTALNLAEDNTVQELIGAPVGFVGPVGIDAAKFDHILIDHGVAAMIAGVAGANKTDYHTARVVPGRDFPLEGKNIKVCDIRNAVDGDTYEGTKLLFKRGIEVGQVFKLGTKYSSKLGAKFLDADGTEKYCLMGCYGIGINRIMASAIELQNDSNGIIWPISIAPWQVIITLAGHTEEILAAGETLYKQLLASGIEILLDDRDARPGVKFKDADLLGIPVKVTAGKRSLKEGCFELKLRDGLLSSNVPIAEAADKVIELVNSLKEKLNVADK